MLDLGRTFLQNVECSPSAPVTVGGDLKLSYAQWLTRIQSAAAGLLDLGLHPGKRLLTIPQNRREMATFHWICQFTGVVIVPLNWCVKSDGLDYCVCDVDARTLVFEPISADAALGSPAAMKILRITLDDTPHSSLSSDILPNAVPWLDSVLPEADDVSLMLYTSGTAGRPEDVPRRHKRERAVALAHVAQNLYRRDERTPGAMPLYHMMGVRSLLAMTLVDGLFTYVRR